MTPSRRRTFLVSVAAVAAVIVVWHLAALDMDPLLLPTPSAVIGAAGELWEQGRLSDAIAISLTRVYSGWLIGSAIAIPIGLLAGTSTYVRAAVDPFIHFFRFIPALALTSLFILWFGIGEASKVNLVVYAVMFIVLVSTASGAASVSQDKLLGAQTMGANRFDLFFRITLPATFPSIFIGMRLALAAAFLVIVAAEAIAAQEGIGFLIWNARLFFRTDFVFVGILLFGILGFLSDRVWKLLGRTVFSRYLTSLGDY